MSRAVGRFQRVRYVYNINYNIKLLLCSPVQHEIESENNHNIIWIYDE